MSNNINPEETRLLIPWYLNGTFDEDEIQKVEELLSSDPKFNDELKEYSLIKSAVFNTDKLVNEQTLAQFEKMEKTIIERIELHVESNEGRKEFSIEQSFLDKVKQFIQSFALPALSPVPIAAIILIQFAVIIGLTEKLYFEEKTQLTTLSGSNAIDLEGPRILIAFEETASEREIREILFEINAKIIDGPKANGIYIIQLSEVPKSIEAVLVKLKNKKSVISFVENWQ